MSDAFLLSQATLWLLVLALSVGYLASHSKLKKAARLYMQGFGIPIKDPFPLFNAAGFQDKDWRAAIKEHRGNIILFTSATCESCQGLYPLISEYALKNDVGITLFMEGDPQLIKNKIDTYQLKVPVYHFTPEMIEITKIPAFPFAYYVSRSGIVYNKGGTQQEAELDILLNDGLHMEKMLDKAV